MLWGASQFGPLVIGLISRISPIDIDIHIGVVNVVSFLITSALALSILKYAVIIILAPLMSQLSEKVERIEMGADVSRPILIHIIPDLLRSLRMNMRNIAKELFFTLLIIVLGWIPVFNIVSAVLLFLLQAYYAGFGNVDYFAERHFSYRQTISYVRDHRAETLGNGIAYLVLLMIPIFGVCLAPPLATVSATLQGLEHTESEE